MSVAIHAAKRLKPSFLAVVGGGAESVPMFGEEEGVRSNCVPRKSKFESLLEAAQSTRKCVS